jgi:hypothetical protein
LAPAPAPRPGSGDASHAREMLGAAADPLLAQLAAHMIQLNPGAAFNGRGAEGEGWGKRIGGGWGRGEAIRSAAQL